MKQKISMRTKWTVQGWLLMLPSLIFLVGFTVYPVIRTLIQSFMKTSNNAKAPAEFIGFKNYINVFRDPVFAIVIKNTLKFSLIVIPLGLVIGFLLATLVSKNIKGIGVARALVFYPNVAPVVGFATIWTFLFTPNIGVISHVMKALSMKPVDFLNNPKTALYAIMAVYLWREASYMMIFYISGLQNISQEYYEAAHLDGASGWGYHAKDHHSAGTAHHPVRADHHHGGRLQDGGPDHGHDHQGRTQQQHQPADESHLPDRLLLLGYGAGVGADHLHAGLYDGGRPGAVHHHGQARVLRKLRRPL
ncbi:hypothetical protein CLOSTASPAR_06397 [[Clostridium] asparagiforme DSM 15981]|uniref:ABC transmembrane type-1 domain-containing protein n=1 Tax=[Clostridium] asparagiforme DSM 15981 TaxID=518636 RepID=C0DAU2_9FIRM|nr:hypothetical protein CLOSTASPAR_06397 [[Clostridium] asparagiforme DSM 15981]